MSGTWILQHHHLSSSGDLHPLLSRANSSIRRISHQEAWSQSLSEELSVGLVMDVLRNCYDPEIPVNIVDLGLVYGVTIDNGTVNVRMTLTAMGCPASAYLSRQVKALIEQTPGLDRAGV